MIYSNFKQKPFKINLVIIILSLLFLWVQRSLSSTTISEDIENKVGALVNLRDESQSTKDLLMANSPSARSLAKNLLGDSIFWFLHSSGSIEKLWSSTTFKWERYREQAGGVGALANRLERFNDKASRLQVITLHREIVDSLTHIFRILKTNLELWGEISRNPYQMRNYRRFVDHKADLEENREDLNALVATDREFAN